MPHSRITDKPPGQKIGQKADTSILSLYQQHLTANTIQRKQLSLFLSLGSVLIGFSLVAYYAWQAYTLPGFNLGIHIVLVILILLNARQNLRQHNLAKILEVITPTRHLTSER